MFQMMRHLAFLVLVSVSACAARAEGIGAQIDLLGGYPCVDSNLTCIDLPVPRNHFGNDPTATQRARFAVHFARGESQGVLLYAVGGPGFAGTLLADSYIAGFGDDLVDNFDIVFFDQRGMGASGALSCPKAQGLLDLAAVSLDQPDEAFATLQTYVDACLRELPDARLLPYMGTAQAIRDVEQFRLAIGAPQVWFYGESYGTRFAQAYAASFPAAMSGVILDGVIDPDLAPMDFAASYATAAEAILARVLAACDHMPDCHADLPMGAAKAFDDLLTRLKAQPAKLDWQFGNGTSASRELTANLMLYAAFSALYEGGLRGEFLRALAASARGDDFPMLSFAYAGLGLDPVDLAESALFDWSGAAYPAVTCGDAPQDNLGAAPDDLFDQARAKAANLRYFAADLVYDAALCRLWPKPFPTPPIPRFEGGDYPTLLLNADADPITPLSMSLSVLERTKNAALVVMEGGPHVIYGRGKTCPDAIVARLMFGELPEATVQYCRQDLVTSYVPLTLPNGVAEADPTALVRALLDEMRLSSDFARWDGSSRTDFACPKGGRISYRAVNAATAFEFADCSFWEGVALTGIGNQITGGDTGDGTWLNLTISGRHSGNLVYVESDETGVWRISGTYDGQPIQP